jgi:hypothetical protein
MDIKPTVLPLILILILILNVAIAISGLLPKFTPIKRGTPVFTNLRRININTTITPTVPGDILPQSAIPAIRISFLVRTIRKQYLPAYSNMLSPSSPRPTPLASHRELYLAAAGQSWRILR